METDQQHPVYKAFWAAGFNEDDLVDPGEMTVEDLKAYEWLLVRWTSHGIEMFDVDEDDLSDQVLGSIEQGVEFTDDHVQPIDFADEHGLLFDEIDPMEKLNAAADPNVTFFARKGYRVVPEMTKEQAVEALSLWGSEGWVPYDTAEAMVEPFGPKGDVTGREDNDVEGLDIVRASFVARWLAGSDDGLDSAGSDSGVLGHKKQRRQQFYRNLDKLQEEYGE